MRVGMIVAQGPGNGHRARCDALRKGLLGAGHEVVGAFDAELDWLVVDDAEYENGVHCDVFNADNVMAVYDNGCGCEFCKPTADIIIKPHEQPRLAWVADRWQGAYYYRQREQPRLRLAYCQMGMSSEGLRMQRDIAKAFAGVDDGPQLMEVAYDVCIGAPGHSSWERCAMGMPTLQIIFCESHKLVGEAIDKADAGITVWNTLDEGPIDLDELEQRCNAVLKDIDLEQMGRNARNLCDGKGVERTIKLMEVG